VSPAGLGIGQLRFNALVLSVLRFDPLLVAHSISRPKTGGLVGGGPLHTMRRVRHRLGNGLFGSQDSN
jgi:hypothetical protein